MRRILLAEDNENLQQAVARIASAHGCELLQTTSGAAVLALAIERQPELIILDFGFPDADGRDVLQKLKAETRTAHIPIVVWSGRVDAESDRRIALDLGAEDYVRKIDVSELLRKIERVLLRFP
jgi:two-component system KDP operon response regulator KdpE